MKIKITRTYRVESVVDIDEVRNLNHLEMLIGGACEKQCHAVVDTIRALEGISGTWCEGETSKEILCNK